MKTIVAIIAALFGVSAAPVSNAVSISPPVDGFPIIQALLRAVAEAPKSTSGSKEIDLDSIIHTISGTTVQHGPHFKVENLAADAQFSSTSTKQGDYSISSNVNFKVQVGSGHTQINCSSSSFAEWINIIALNLPLTGPVACSDAKTFFFLMPAFGATRLGLFHAESDEAVPITSYSFGLHTIPQNELLTTPDNAIPSVVYEGSKTLNVPSLKFELQPKNHAARMVDEHSGIDALLSTLAGALMNPAANREMMAYPHGLPFKPAQNITVENLTAKVVAAQDKQLISTRVAETIALDIRAGPDQVPVKCNFDSNRVGKGWENDKHDLDIRTFRCSDKKTGVVLTRAPKYASNEKFPGYMLSIFKHSAQAPSSWTILGGVHLIGKRDIKVATRPGAVIDSYEFSYVGPTKFVVPGYKISITGSAQDGKKVDRPCS